MKLRFRSFLVFVSFCNLYTGTTTCRGRYDGIVMVCCAFDAIRLRPRRTVTTASSSSRGSLMFAIPPQRKGTDSFASSSSSSSPFASSGSPQQQQQIQRQQQLERVLNRAILLYNQSQDANVRNQVSTVIVTLEQERAANAPPTSRRQNQLEQQQEQTDLDAVEQLLDSLSSSSPNRQDEEEERNRAAQRIEEAILMGVDYATIASMVQDYARRFNNAASTRRDLNRSSNEQNSNSYVSFKQPQSPLLRDDSMDNPAVAVYGTGPSSSMDMAGSGRYVQDTDDNSSTDEDGYPNEQEVRQILYKAAEAIEQAIDRGVPFDQINAMVEAYARVKQRLERTSQQKSETSSLSPRKESSPPTTTLAPVSSTTRSSLPPRRVVKRVPRSRTRASAVSTAPYSPAPPSKAEALPRTAANTVPPLQPTSPKATTSSNSRSSASTSNSRSSTMPARTPTATPFVPPRQLQRQTLLAQQMEEALLQDDDTDDDTSGSGRDPVERFLLALQQPSSPVEASASPRPAAAMSPIQPQKPQQQQKSLAPNQRRLAQQLEDALLQDLSDDDSGDGDPIQRFMNSLPAQKTQQQSATIPSGGSRRDANGGTPDSRPPRTRTTADLAEVNIDDRNVSNAYTPDRIESFIQSLREIRQIPTSNATTTTTTTTNTVTGEFTMEEPSPPVVQESFRMTGNQKSPSMADDAPATISPEVRALEDRRRTSQQLDAYLEKGTTEPIENFIETVQNAAQKRTKQIEEIQQDVPSSSRSSSVPFYFANNTGAAVNDRSNRDSATKSQNDIAVGAEKNTRTTNFIPETVPPEWLLENDAEPKTSEDLERLENRILKYLTPRAPTIQDVVDAGKEGISLAVRLATKATPIVGQGVETAWNRLGSVATAWYKRKAVTDKESNPLNGLARSLAENQEAIYSVDLVSPVASADDVDPKSSTYLFRLRTAKVAAVAKAGQSRWNEMENQRAIQLMDSKTSSARSAAASGPKTVSGDDLIPNVAQKLSASYLFQQRTFKVAKAAKAGQSRWGAMETQRAIEMMEGKAAAATPTTVSAPAERLTMPIARGAADSTLYQQRNRKVAAAAAVNRSRWGEMENQKVAKMMGYPLPQPSTPATPASVSPRGASAEQLAREWAAMNRDGNDNDVSLRSPFDLKPLSAVREVPLSSTRIDAVTSTVETIDDGMRPDVYDESNKQTGSKATYHDSTRTNKERKIDKADRVAFLQKLQAETQIPLSSENLPKIDRAALMQRLKAPPESISLPCLEVTAHDKGIDWQQQYFDEANAPPPTTETPMAAVMGWERLAREWAQRNSDAEKSTMPDTDRVTQSGVVVSKPTIEEPMVMLPSSAPASSAGLGGWEQLANDWVRMNRDTSSPRQGGQAIQSKPAIADTRDSASTESLDKSSTKIEAVASPPTKSSSATGGLGWEQLANDWTQRNRELENTGRTDLYVTAERTEKPTSSSSLSDLPPGSSFVATRGWERLASEWAAINASEDQRAKTSPSQMVTTNVAGQRVGPSKPKDSLSVGVAAMKTNGSWEALAREWAQRNRSD